MKIRVTEEVRNRYFAITGHWKGEGGRIDGYIVTDKRGIMAGGKDIFLCDVTEEDLIEAMEQGENGQFDFVVDGYEEITELYK